MPWRVASMKEVRRSFCERVLTSRANLSSVCQEYGISRKTGYKWLRRYQSQGDRGLLNKSRRPHRSPHKVTAGVEAMVIKLKEQYPYWGPRKIHRLLYQAHPEAERVGISTIGRILSRHGLVIPRQEPETHPIVGRFERGEPNELWQMDLKMAMRMPDGSRQHVAGILDDHSRYVLGLWWLPDITDSSVLSCWIDAARRYGLPRQTLTDHGAQFCMGDHTTSAFRVYLWACGVEHRQGRIGHPQTQGKIERFWGTFQRELTPQLRQADSSKWSLLSEDWLSQYNTLRPHESLADQPPASRYRKSKQSFRKPDRNARIGQPGSVFRKVSAKGRISLGSHRVGVGRGLTRWVVELRPLGNGCWHVYFRNHFLREFILTKPLRGVTHVPEHL